MDKSENIGILIEKYLSDQCTPEEIDQVAAILQSEEYRGKIQALLFDYWNNTPSFQHKIAENELGHMLDSIHHQINLEEKPARSVVKRLSFYASRVAAVLFIPLLIFSVWQLATTFGSNEQAYMTLETPIGSRIKTTLPDGTEVWQNAGTILKYPSDFSEHKREVYLLGEAYFHVKSDEKHPFLVKSPEGVIKVTGTRFNVSNYKTDHTYSVVLEEGKVSFTPRGRSKEISMKPLQQIMLNKENGVLQKRNTDTERFTSWKDGKLIFRDDSLDDIVARLNRWFGADISIGDEDIKGYTFNMTVQYETVEQVLAYITQASGLRLKREKIKANGALVTTKYEISKKNYELR